MAARLGGRPRAHIVTTDDADFDAFGEFVAGLAFSRSERRKGRHRTFQIAKVFA